MLCSVQIANNTLSDIIFLIRSPVGISLHAELFIAHQLLSYVVSVLRASSVVMGKHNSLDLIFMFALIVCIRSNQSAVRMETVSVVVLSVDLLH